MAQVKYKETQRLHQWDMMAIIGVLLVSGFFAFFQVIFTHQPNRNLLILIGLGIMVLSGVFLYLHALRWVAKYNEKGITITLMPVGKVKQKIRWEDVVSSEIVECGSSSGWQIPVASFSGGAAVFSAKTNMMLRLRLRDDQEITLGCSHPEQLQPFIDHIRQLSSSTQE